MSIGAKIETNSSRTAPLFNGGTSPASNSTYKQQINIPIGGTPDEPDDNLTISSSCTTSFTTVNNNFTKPDFNSIKTNDEFREKLNELFKKYGVELSEIETEIKKKIADMFPDCHLEHNKPNNPRTLTPEKMERVYAYCEELLIRASYQKNSDKITLENIINAHNTIRSEKLAGLFASGKETFTLEDIKNAGLAHEFTRVANNDLQTLSDEDLKELTKCYKHAYIETNGNVEEAFEKARNYYIVSDYMSIEEFNEGIKNKTILGFKEKYSLRGTESEAEIKEKVDLYHNEQNRIYVQRLNNGEKPEDLIKEQATELRIMFAASDREDKMQIVHSIQHLYAENRVLFFELFNTLDEDTRNDIADLVNNRELQTILRDPDIFNQRMNEGDAKFITERVRSNQSFEVAKKNNIDFNNSLEEFENREDVKILLEKLENGEELTETEQNLYELYQILRGGATGQILGSANNIHSTEEQREQLVQECCEGLQNSTIYEEVIQELKDYIKENPDLINLSAEKFEEIVEQAKQAVLTEGSLSTTKESKAKNAYESNNLATKTTNPQTHINNIAPNKVEETIPEIAKNPNNENNIKEKPTTVEEAIKYGVPVPEVITLAFGDGIKGVRTLLNNMENLPVCVKDAAIRWFKTYKRDQDNIIASVKTGVAMMLLPHTSEPILERLNSKTLNSYALNKAIEKETEELQEKNKKFSYECIA